MGGVQVGGPVCCGQTGEVSADERICPSSTPVCSGFIQGSQWGKCSEALGTKTEDQVSQEIAQMEAQTAEEASGCAADTGVEIGGPVCCGQTGVVSAAYRVCPPSFPVCEGFIQGSKWGTCQAVVEENKTDIAPQAQNSSNVDEAAKNSSNVDEAANATAEKHSPEAKKAKAAPKPKPENIKKQAKPEINKKRADSAKQPTTKLQKTQ